MNSSGMIGALKGQGPRGRTSATRPAGGLRILPECRQRSASETRCPGTSAPVYSIERIWGTRSAKGSRHVHRAWGCSLSDPGTETPPPIMCSFSKASFPVFLVFSFLTTFMGPALSRRNQGRHRAVTVLAAVCQLLLFPCLVLSHLHPPFGHIYTMTYDECFVFFLGSTSVFNAAKFCWTALLVQEDIYL